MPNKNKKKKSRPARNPRSTDGFSHAKKVSFPPGSSVEMKNLDIAGNNQNYDSTGTLTPINLIGESLTNSGRVGQTVCIKEIELHRDFNPANTYTSPSQACRTMIVYDRQPNGALPAITDILTSSTSLSFYNVNNRGRFVIVSDNIEDVCIGGGAGTQSLFIHPSLKTKMKVSLPVIFGTANANIAAINTGALLLITIGSETAGATNTLLANFHTRILYTDD